MTESQTETHSQVIDPDDDPLVFTIEMRLSGNITYVCADDQQDRLPGALRVIAAAMESGAIPVVPDPEDGP